METRTEVEDLALKIYDLLLCRLRLVGALIVTHDVNRRLVHCCSAHSYTFSRYEGRPKLILVSLPLILHLKRHKTLVLWVETVLCSDGQMLIFGWLCRYSFFTKVHIERLLISLRWILNPSCFICWVLVWKHCWGCLKNLLIWWVSLLKFENRRSGVN